MTVHQLKCDQPYFEQILDGSKIFEARLNDRNFQVGDTLQLAERNAQTGRMTGRHTLRIITSIQPRAEQYWPLAALDRHGLAILTVGDTQHFAASSLNPHAAAGSLALRQQQVDRAVLILRERFSLAWAEYTTTERDQFYQQVAERIIQP